VPDLTVARYVERNALRSGLVARAEDWRWSSLWRRARGTPQDRAILAEWPVDRPADWLAWVNAPQTAAEEEAVRQSLRRGRPFGADGWQRATVAALGLLGTFRDRARPPKRPQQAE
jgi:putative transposase